MRLFYALLIWMLCSVEVFAAATVTQAPPIKFQFTNSAGVPLVGGKLFTYAAGTTTKQATYTDSTGSTQNTNPIILDSRGQANIWVDITKTYKFTLSPSTDTDPPTAPIWTVDGVAAASSGSISFLQAGSGAVSRTLQSKVREALSVTDFGATGNCSTNDAAAINLTIVFAALTGREVFIPAAPSGCYVLGTTSISVLNGVRFVGEGINSVVFTYSGAGVAIDSTGTTALENFTVWTSDLAGSGIRKNGVSRVGSIQNVTVVNKYGTIANSSGSCLIYRAQAGDVGFSGEEVINNLECNGYKKGIEAIGSVAPRTWTSITGIGVIINCGSGIANSRGIQFDSNTNGVGTVFVGGSIEGCAVGLQADNGSAGFSWRGNMEANAVDYGPTSSFGASYNGCVEILGTNYERFCQIADAPPGGIGRWWQELHQAGVPSQLTSYYGYFRDLYNGGSNVLPWVARRGATSGIDGGSPAEIAGFYFGAAGDSNPEKNYALMPQGHRISYCNAAAPTGGPLTFGDIAGSWALGDLCINRVRVVGSVPSYFPSVAGAPGTWVADRARGTMTLANAACTTKVDANAQTASVITLMPTNAAAATLMGAATSLYVATRTAATSFQVCTANAAAAAGTETFEYMILN